MKIVRLLSSIEKPHRLEILHLIRQRGSIDVSEIASAVKLSYMGAKDHCKKLHKMGLLTTDRAPGKVGRPRMLYRLTAKAEDIFSPPGNDVLLGILAGSAKLFGSQAPEKLLFLHFQQQEEAYRKRLRGRSAEEKATWLARLRDADGYLSNFHPRPNACIVERANPLKDVYEAYPVCQEFERKMFESLIGKPVSISKNTAGGRSERIFTLSL